MTQDYWQNTSDFTHEINYIYIGTCNHTVEDMRDCLSTRGRTAVCFVDCGVSMFAERVASGFMLEVPVR